MVDRQQPLGRPRDSRVDHAITAATRALLGELGYAQLTVAAVAARAGIGKAAIYRRYGTKEEMIFAAVVHGLDLVPPPDSGSLRGDLSALVQHILASLAGPPDGTVPGLLADVHADEAIAARFTQTFIVAQQACVTEVLDRAVTRGELARQPDPAVVHALLLGPVFAWLFLLRRGRAEAAAFADTLARLATTALMGHPTTSPT